MEILALVLGVLFCGVIGAALGRMKGRGAGGCFLGCIFGPLGWIIVLLLPSVASADDADPISPEFLARRAALKSGNGSKSRDEAWARAQAEE